MAEIILIATSDVKGARIGVETINVKLTLSMTTLVWIFQLCL